MCKKSQKGPACTLARATLAGGALSLIGCALSISSALLPWVFVPANEAAGLLLAQALASGVPASAAGALANATALMPTTPYMLGLVAPCELVSAIPACSKFDAKGFTPTSAAQGTAACLILGFIAGLLGFLLSFISWMGCCTTPAAARARFSLALLGLLFSGAGCVIGGAFLPLPFGGTLADMIKVKPAWVGSGLGVAVAGTVLQFAALVVVLGTCCCCRQKAPLASEAVTAAATPAKKAKSRAAPKEEEAEEKAEKGKVVISNPLEGKSGGKGADPDKAEETKDADKPPKP
jgi:hypothetical protein